MAASAPSGNGGAGPHLLPVSLHLTSAPPQEVITAKQPVKVVIVRQDRSRVEPSQLKIEGDSIGGTNWDVKPGSPPSRVAIAFADVRTVEVRETDTRRTIAAVGFVGSIIAFIVALSSGWTAK